MKFGNETIKYAIIILKKNLNKTNDNIQRQIKSVVPFTTLMWFDYIERTERNTIEFFL